MRRALAFSIHVAHVALMLIAALAGPGDRQRVTPQASPSVVTGGVPLWRRERVDTLMSSPTDVAPSCPMPVWRADMSVRYAILVVGVDPSSNPPAPRCANGCVRAAGR